MTGPRDIETEKLATLLAAVQRKIYAQKMRIKHGLKNMTIERFDILAAMNELERLYIDRNILKKKMEDL